MEYIERRFRGLYCAMLACFVLFGVTLTIIGATLPKIITGFRWSYLSVGIVLSSGSVAYFVSAFVSGLLVQRFGPKRVILVGLGLQALGLSFFAATPSVGVNLLLCALMGTGHGCLEVVVNFSVVRMERGGRSRLMNLAHAAFSVGAILGPFVLAGLLGLGGSWQGVYRLMAGASVLMAGVLWGLSFSGVAHSPAEREQAAPPTRHLLRQPLLILSFLMLMLYVGSELGVSNWLAEYYVKVLGASEFVGGLMVSVYWTGLLAGRLGISYGYRGHRPAEVMGVLAVACTVGLAFAVLAGDAVLAGVGFFAAGLGYSAIYPLVMTMVGKHFPRGQSVALGFASTGGGIGSFALPFVMAAIADRFGLQRGFFFYVGLNAIMVVVAVAIIRQARKRE